MELEKGLISYYKPLIMSRVRQLRLRVVPVNFRIVVVSVCHVYPLLGDSHDNRSLFRILAWFWCRIVNN